MLHNVAVTRFSVEMVFVLERDFSVTALITVEIGMMKLVLVVLTLAYTNNTHLVFLCLF